MFDIAAGSDKAGPTAIRIAICNWSRRKVGGTETYLGNVASYLHRNGYELGFFHETDNPADREPIALPVGVPTWCVESMGKARALSALLEWKPDVIYTNIIESVGLEEALLDIAPAVFDAHAFYGTCVGGTKCFKFPEPMPCNRTLGVQCLLRYYPRRCGGLNPVTMVRLYRRETARHALLSRYGAVITHSEYMRAEYIKHGVSPHNAFNVSAGLFDQSNGAVATDLVQLENRRAPAVTHGGRGDAPIRLLFVGRMDLLKGGHVLLEALPAIQAALGRPISLSFAGEGPARAKWEHRARRLQSENSAIAVNFRGWVAGDALDQLYRHADLLVVPSLWPEPFGRIGLEAGRYGVPAAAFAVGGISDWLVDGLNGHLAPGDPPTVEGLAGAVIRCLHDPTHYEQLQIEALARSQVGGRGGSWPLLREILDNVARSTN